MSIKTHFLIFASTALVKVVLGSDEAALALASWPSLIARLFALMTTPRLLDGAVSLAQVGHKEKEKRAHYEKVQNQSLMSLLLSSNFDVKAFQYTPLFLFFLHSFALSAPFPFSLVFCLLSCTALGAPLVGARHVQLSRRPQLEWHCREVAASCLQPLFSHASCAVVQA